MEGQVYFKELSRVLVRDELSPQLPKGSLMEVELAGRPLCCVTDKAGVRFGPKIREDPELERALNKVASAALDVNEYVRAIEEAPALSSSGLSKDEGYRVLADFNGTVLAARLTGYDPEFVTWDWAYDHVSLVHGHYFVNYRAAKQDFAVRSGLVREAQLFGGELLAEIYRCVKAVMESEDPEGCRPKTLDREHLLADILKQIEAAAPDLSQLVAQSIQAEELEQ